MLFQVGYTKNAYTEYKSSAILCSLNQSEHFDDPNSNIIPFGINFSKDLICMPKVILSKHVLPCFCVSLWQLLKVIRSGMLLYGVPTRDSAPILSSDRNRNSTRVGVDK